MNLNNTADRAADRGGIGRGGFSLIEVTLAMGVVSFAFISILGLLPMGMTDFRSSIDSTVGAQIGQQMVNQAQETDFTALVASGSPYLTGTTSYFDVDGRQLAGAGGAVYWARAVATSSPTLPGAGIANASMATVTVQIANNPGGLQLTPNPQTNLWEAPSGVSMRIYSSVVSGYCVSGTSG